MFNETYPDAKETLARWAGFRNNCPSSCSSEIYGKYHITHFYTHTLHTYRTTHTHRARKAKTVPVVTISTQTNILATPKADTPLARVASLLDKDDETDLSSSEESEGARLNVGAESDESSDDSSDEINVRTVV